MANESRVVDIPRVKLDLAGTDHHAEGNRLRSAGPVLQIELPDGIVGWAITRQDLLAELLADADNVLSKDLSHWSAQLPEGWPLTGMVKVTNMVTADGLDHRRLRRTVTSFLTPQRVKSIQPCIAALVHDLLDDLPQHLGAEGTVDLSAYLFSPLPLSVICELVGVPEAYCQRIRKLVDSIFNHTADAQEVVTTQESIVALMEGLVNFRRAHPGDDLTTHLISERDRGVITDTELSDTMWLMVSAGYETTRSLLVNGTRALLTHPDQRAMAVGGDAAAWAAVVEETLRWDSPVANFLARYALKDIIVAGVTIPAGEAIIAPYSAVGRDAACHGADADRFDVSRTTRHMSFGAGPHACLGSHLARLQATTALPALFARYPHLALAVEESDLSPIPSAISNSVLQLPVKLDARRPQRQPSGGAGA
ncbi:cytochrome P450 [Streptomyces sp. NPDC048196]|uniref:cytochrome P450 family protein n=1 Tax=Streptomyces sp. NPDC048196 TaxID=3154712 RepID=UPI0033E001F7